MEERLILNQHRKGPVIAHNLWGGWPDIWHGRKNLRELLNPDNKPLGPVRPLVPILPVHIIDGSLSGLVRFLSSETQVNAQDRYRYLLTGGVAVELVTGFTRFHKDLDLAILDDRNEWWKRYTIDGVTPHRYWAEMTFEPQYLERTAYQVSFSVDSQSYTAATVHPAIILTQKLSDACGRAPREIDLTDVRALANFWLGHERGSQRWVQIISTAISALPSSRRETTTNRILPYLKVARRRSTIERFCPWLVNLIPQAFTV